MTMELGFALLLDQFDSVDIVAKERSIHDRAKFAHKMDEEDNVPYVMLARGDMSLNAEDIRKVADAVAKILRQSGGDLGCVMDNVLPVEYVKRELTNENVHAEGKGYVDRKYLLTLKDKDGRLSNISEKVTKLCSVDTAGSAADAPGIFIGEAHTNEPLMALMFAQNAFSSLQGKEAVFTSVVVYGYADDGRRQVRKVVYKVDM